MKIAQKTLEIIITQISVEQMPRNSSSGSEVDNYLKSIRLAKFTPGAWHLFIGIRK